MGKPHQQNLSSNKATKITQVVLLPTDLGTLAEQAAQEGFAFLNRLMSEFESGVNRFAQPGEALFEARSAGVLVGIGGLNCDPYIVQPLSNVSAGRVRRLYIDPAYRRYGIASQIMDAIERSADGSFTQLRLRTDTERGAKFYTALGYEALSNDDHATHHKEIV